MTDINYRYFHMHYTSGRLALGVSISHYGINPTSTLDLFIGPFVINLGPNRYLKLRNAI